MEMSQLKDKKENKDLVKKSIGVSLFDEESDIDTTHKVERSISIVNNGETIEGDTDLPFYNKIFAKLFSDKEIEIKGQL